MTSAHAPLRQPLVVVGWVLAAGVWHAPLSLWAQEDLRVVQVEVRGTKTVAPETILAKVQTKPGVPYREGIVSEDIRRLFGLGYFTDVRADLETLPEGVKLTFVVKEKPSVASIQVEGNRALKTTRLMELLGIEEGQLYDPRRLKDAVEAIKAEYARKGFAQCELATRVETDEAVNTTRIYLLIDEGARMRVAQMLIEGNQVFSDGRLRRLLKTKRRGLWRSGIYNEQVLEEDLDRIKAFYQQHGYQDIAVSHAVSRDPQGQGLIVHLTLTEGVQHRVGQIAISGAVLFPEREIRRVLTLKPGAVYNPEQLREDLRLIKQYYGDRGYLHAEVVPDPQWDPDTARVNLTYHITEDELVYVNRVEVNGNLRTKDVVIRREVRLYPGEAFNGAKIRRTIERLYNLGLFEEVEVETQPTSQRDREDLVVAVKEAKTGSISFGGGFSSVDRLVGLAELEQRNFDLSGFPHFTGAGQDLRLRAEVGAVRRFFDVSFTEPWIFGRPLSFGIDAFNRTRLRSRRQGLAFEEEQRGGGIRLGKEFADVLRLGVSYQLFRTEISDVVAEASADLKAEQGRNDISVAGLSVAFDRRDSRFDPTRGFYAFAQADLAGGILAADKDFYRLQHGMSFYWPHLGRLVLETRFQTGIVDAYGDSAEVPIFERFFAGGANTVRGFRERRLGPIDPFSSDPIGGEATLIGTVEEVVTLVTDERGRPIVRASAFYDVGNVWRRVGDYAESFKSGTGVGARVNTPIGPLRLDIGFPISRVEGEERKARFHFNISRSF